jgi:hypothetical protein
MADVAPVAAAGAAGALPNPRQTGGTSIWGSLVRMGLLWMFFNYMKGGGGPPKDGVPVAGAPAPRGYLVPAHAKGTYLDFTFYIDNSQYRQDFGPEDIVWEQRKVALALGSAEEITIVYHPSEVWP